MAQEPYLPPPWMAAHVGNRIAALFERRFISQLTVVGVGEAKGRRVLRVSGEEGVAAQQSEVAANGVEVDVAAELLAPENLLEFLQKQRRDDQIQAAGLRLLQQLRRGCPWG